MSAWCAQMFKKTINIRQKACAVGFKGQSGDIVTIMVIVCCNVEHLLEQGYFLRNEQGSRASSIGLLTDLSSCQSSEIKN